jgi:hypothetical protein
MADLTNKFALDSIDHDELLHFLSLTYGTAWRTQTLTRNLATEIAFPASERFALRLLYRQGRIEKVFSGPLLSRKRELTTLLEELNINCRDSAIREYGRGLLMASLPIRGSYLAPSAHIQILPPTDDLPRPSDLHGQNPFLIEFPIRAWQRDGIRLWRRRKCLIEWAWVLNTLLSVRVCVESPRPSKAWIFNILDESYVYAQKMFPVFRGSIIEPALSPTGSALPVVPSANYYADWRSPARGSLPLDELFVPDDLDEACAKFSALQGIERHRFLSAASIVDIASASWETSISTSFIGTVQAIECIAQELPKSVRRWSFCKRPIGPTSRFRQVCEKHGVAAGVDDKILGQLYDIRSALVHGESLFDIDRHPWGTGIAGTVLGLGDIDAAGAVIRLAKAILRDWLMARP